MNHFDHELYLNLYPDLKENNINTFQEAKTHWINHGKNENRISTLSKFIKNYNFDYSFYVNFYNLNNISNIKEAILDWLSIGKNLGRVVNKSNLSDEESRTFFDIESQPIHAKFFKLNSQFNLDFLSEQKAEIAFCKIRHDKNLCKGINIDLDILNNALSSLNFCNLKNIFINETDYNWLSNNKSKRKMEISLDYEYYIFSEIVLFDLCVYLLKNNKKVIIVPNIDSYETFSDETDWFKNLQKLNSFPHFHIWSKTKQIYNWMEKYSIKNNTFLNFLFYKNKLNSTISKSDEPYILLDTGSSLTDRKYLIEIANIFYRYNVGFKLVIKTVPIVYKKKRLHLYERSENIIVVNKMMSMKELDSFYSRFEYIIYLAKFDGFGLTLSKAMNYNMFIFSGDGLPWNEILNHYPRKCLIEMNQDFTKRNKNGDKGFSRSQIFYKCNFSDLIQKLKIVYMDRTKVKMKYEVIFYNWLNRYIFLSNLYHFFNTESYYNKSAVHLCSFKDRSIILLENIVPILFQSGNINIYLNSSHEYTLHFLGRMNNVYVTPFYKDMRALSKLYCLCTSKSKCVYNFIIDDDIIYPKDYIINSCRNINSSADSNSVYSYNGFFKNYKLSFMKKHNQNLNGHQIDVLGTGTVFFKGFNLFSRDKLLQQLKNNSNSSGIFADKFFSNFLEREGIKKRYYNSNKFMWMTNNSKISLNPTAGLYEYKIKNNLIKEEFIGVNIDKDISFRKVLYYIINNSLMTDSEISEQSKIKNLSLFLHTKVISNIKDIEAQYNDYEYLIIDTYNNLSENDSPVKIIQRDDNNKSFTLSIKEFIATL